MKKKGHYTFMSILVENMEWGERGDEEGLHILYTLFNLAVPEILQIFDFLGRR